MVATSSFKVGGSLDGDNAFYVARAADQELYEHLKAGDTCFVFNSRQMGKSSLRVRTMLRLRQEGVVCAVIDPQSRGTTPTEEQWYAGTLKRLIEDLGLAEAVPFSAWWKEGSVQALSPVNRFEEFIDKIMLAQITAPIVLFVEEVDNLLSLKFDTDGFFGMIRSLHERRSEHPAYQRLSFCFLGVATPYDLIRGDNRSAFNIGHAVELAGFSLGEARPLLGGLQGRVADPPGVLAAVIHWSGGQPFLTQKLLGLVSATAVTKRARVAAAKLVATLAREQIIRNWEAQDSPVHLRTIRDRLLQGDERHRGRLLGMVQRIQEQGAIPADSSREQMQLRLTGLVVPRDGQLRFYNPIYAAVFTPDWVRSQLQELRPTIYAQSINDWEKALPAERASHLIGGAALVEALGWARGKSLSPADQEFLEASEAAAESASRAAEATRMAEERAQVAEREARLRRKVAAGLSTALVALVGLSVFAWHQKRVAQLREQAAVVISQATDTPVESLIHAIVLSRQSQGLGFMDLNPRGTDPLAVALAATIGWGEADRFVGHQGAVMAVAFSPDGTRLVSGSADNSLRIWDVATGQPIGAPLLGHTARVRAVAFSPDGRRIVSGAEDHTLRLWDASSGQLIGRPLEGHRGAVRSVAFSPDGRLILSGSVDHTLRLWDAGSGRPIGLPLHGHRDAVKSVAFSRDGRRFVSGSADGTLRRWVGTTGTPLGPPMAGHSQDVRAVAFSPDGNQIVSGSTDRTVRRWDAKSGKPLGIPLVGHADAVRSVAFSPDGSSIVSGSADNTLRLWDASDGKPLGTALRGHRGSINAVAFSPNGQQIISAGADHSLRLWDAHVGQVFSPLRAALSQGVKTIAFSPDGRRIVAGLADHSLRLWDVATGRLRGTLRHGHTGAVKTVAISPDGRRIVSGSRDTTLRIWDLVAGRPIGQPLVGHSGAIRDAAFSPDGRRIVSASEDTTLRLWDAATGQAIGQPLRGHTDWVKRVIYSPDGRRMISASSDTTLRLWDGDTGRAIAPPLRGHDDVVNTVAISPDGHRIVSGSSDSNLRLWDAQTGKRLGRPLIDHAAAVRAVVFSPDGRRIISASADNTLRIWDAHTGRAIRADVEIDQAEVNAMAFSPDGTKIVTVAADGSLRIWENSPFSNLFSACQRLHRHQLLLHPEIFELSKDFASIAREARQLCHDGPQHSAATSAHLARPLHWLRHTLRLG